MDDSVSTASNQDTSKKTAQSNHTAPGAGHKDMYLQGALLNSKATSQIRKDMNFGRTVRAMKLTKKSGKGHKTNHNSCTRITDVYTVPMITNPMIAPQDNNTKPTPLAILPVAQVFIKTPANFQTPHMLHIKANPLLVSPHLHSQSLTHHFSIISNIRHQLTKNYKLPGMTTAFSTIYTITSKPITNTTSAIQPTNSTTLLSTIPTLE